MHKSTVIPTINSITQWISVREAAGATEKCRLRILNPHLFFCLNTHREMTNFITLPIPLSERSELKPNYHTRAKLKAFPLNGCNPSPDKWAAPLPLCYRPLSPLPAFKPLHSCQHTSSLRQLWGNSFDTSGTFALPRATYQSFIHDKIFGIETNLSERSCFDSNVSNQNWCLAWWNWESEGGSVYLEGPLVVHVVRSDPSMSRRPICSSGQWLHTFVL